MIQRATLWHTNALSEAEDLLVAVGFVMETGHQCLLANGLQLCGHRNAPNLRVFVS